SGAVIAISVLCVCLLVIVPILAAIAIPQYQKYVTRSQATAAYYSAVALKPAVVEAYNNMGRCPANGEAGIRNASDYAEKNVSAIDTGAFEGQNDTCAIQVTIKSTSHQIDGKHIWLSTTPSQGSQWTCSTDLPASEAPMQCR
ncbi:pilin, partial [Dyella sp.]|uniref:pilin n=1 Tax=Dyella sp. TaxID=1869338 RepID=UPI002ED65502